VVDAFSVLDKAPQSALAGRHEGRKPLQPVARAFILTEHQFRSRLALQVRILPPLESADFAPVISKRDSDNLLGLTRGLSMLRLSILTAVLAFCSAPTWADSIELDVNAWATFTATQPCTSNCTETIRVNFLYIPPPTVNITPENFLGTVVPGTMDVSSTGFLGAFSAFSGGVVNSQGFVGFSGSSGDEIDLNILSNNGFQPGINTADFDLFSCESQACQTAFGTADHHPNPTSQSSLVSRVAVPDGTSFLSLTLAAFGAIGIVWRWRTKEGSEA